MQTLINLGILIAVAVFIVLPLFGSARHSSPATDTWPARDTVATWPIMPSPPVTGWRRSDR